MKSREEKTNAIRLLEQKKLPFKVHDYSQSDAVNGMELRIIYTKIPTVSLKR